MRYVNTFLPFDNTGFSVFLLLKLDIKLTNRVLIFRASFKKLSHFNAENYLFLSGWGNKVFIIGSGQCAEKLIWHELEN